MIDTGSRPLINALLSAPPKSWKIFVATLEGSEKPNSHVQMSICLNHSAFLALCKERINFYRCVDDASVDYTSLLDREQMRARFSEMELLDSELRESVRLQKMYRELQRQVNCWDRNKVRTPPNYIYLDTKLFIFGCRFTIILTPH